VRAEVQARASALAIPLAEVARLAQCPPGGRWDEALENAIEEARGAAEPRGRWCPVPDQEVAGVFDDQTPVASIARGGQRWAFVATIGDSLEGQVRDHFSAGRYLEGVLLDAAGSTAVESLCDLVEGAAAGGAQTVRFSPGYCRWSMECQRRLFELLAPEELGVRLLPSLLMQPLKSVSGIVVAGDPETLRVPKESCRACDSRGCSRR